MARRAVIGGPVLVALAGLGWGVDGAFSAAFAVALVVANFLVAAASMAKAARIGLAVLMATVLAGYVVRLAAMAVAVWAVSGASWFEAVPLGLVLILAHLGLLAWEAKYVSATLAFPGLRPDHGPSVRSGKELSTP